MTNAAAMAIAAVAATMRECDEATSVPAGRTSRHNAGPAQRASRIAIAPPAMASVALSSIR